MTRRRELALLVGALLLFTALAALRAARHPFPFYDDVGYLHTGSEIAALGGPLALVRALYEGTFGEANRHPLYLALLSLVAGTDAAYHLRAQALTIATGVFALLACWWVVRRHFGVPAAIVTVALLGASNTMLDNAARETCEPLLVALWALCVGAILDGWERPQRWALAGVFAGLAYLTKGTGIFLPICFGIALLIERRWRALADPWAWSFGAGFALAASPLLVRNVVAYGSPLYTTNSRFMWIDRLSDFAEIHAPRANELLTDGPREYFANTTLGAIVQRFAMGFVETTVHVGDAMSFTAPKNGGAVHVVWVIAGLAAAAYAVYLLWRARPSWQRTFLLVQSAWAYAFFVFYNAVAGSSRYLLPATIWLVAVLARHLMREETPRLVAWRKRVGVLAAAAIALTIALGGSIGEKPPGFEAAEEWLVAHVGERETFAVDSRTRLQPQWRMPNAHQEIVSASFRDKPVDADELIAHFRAKNVRYVLLDASSAKNFGGAGDPESRRYFFYDRVRLEPDGSLPVAGYPSGLRVAYADAGQPRRFVVLELER